jgi:phosphopantetheinyl transferase
VQSSTIVTSVLDHRLQYGESSPLPFMHRYVAFDAHTETWPVDCADRLPGELADILSQDELARAAGYRAAADRHAFALRRAALCILIGGRLACDPKAVRFSCNAFGRRQLAWPRPHRPFSFSMARTSNLALIEIGAGESIGVDVERVRDDIDFVDAGRIVFAATEMAWLADGNSTQSADRFFRLWTCKEAYLKALGFGFMRDPRLFVPAVIGEMPTQPPATRLELPFPPRGAAVELPLGKCLRGAFAVA